jgi:hypothetical protein
MKKEIVIAAFREQCEWLPSSWRPITTIYRCGPATAYLRKQDGFFGELDKIRAIFELGREIGAIPEKSNTSHIGQTSVAERHSANCPKAREAEQWLNHIITRYGALADVTVFLQGHPHDHCQEIVELVDSLTDVSFTTLPRREPSNAGGEAEFCGAFWAKLGQTDLKKVCWAAGAQFAASRDVIQSRPLEWYLQVQKLARQTDRSGEILERTWWNILGCP